MCVYLYVCVWVRGLGVRALLSYFVMYERFACSMGFAKTIPFVYFTNSNKFYLYLKVTDAHIQLVYRRNLPLCAKGECRLVMVVKI